jgi:hypothetical protein
MRFFRSFSLKGLSLFEMMVAVSIILIFFAISVSSFIFFYYNFNVSDKYKETSIFRTVYFELSRAIREASVIKKIYDTYPNKAIYLQIGNYLYSYKLDTNNRKFYKSTDGGHSFYSLPNAYNIKDIKFINKSSMVYVYFYTEFNNTKQEHAFLVKLRKENKNYFIISGINTNTNLIEYAISSNESSFTNFTPLNQSNTSNSFNIDTKLGSYNIIFPKIGSTNSYYHLFKAYKNDPNSNWNYNDLDNTNSYSYSLPSNDWGLGSRTKILSVGNYLYTAYVNNNEVLYDPTDGQFKQYNVVYFAYRKLDSNYKGNWVKKEVFRFPTSYNAYTMVIRYPRIAYGLAGDNRFHIVFSTEGGNNSVNDMYYAGSDDGINWNVINLDKKLMGATENNLYPIVPIVLVGNISNTTNTLNFLFYNNTTSTPYNMRICYFSTNDLNTFSGIQSLNDQAYYSNNSNPITINTFGDMDAYFFNNSINIVVSCNAKPGSPIGQKWAGNRDKLIYFSKSTFNNRTDYNFYPDDANNSSNIFTNCSLILTPMTYSSDTIGEVHIVGYSSTSLRIIYLRNTYGNALSTSFAAFTNTLTTNTFPNLDINYSIGVNTAYIHVAAYNSTLQDLDYFRITSTSAGATFSRINNNDTSDNDTIDDNINLSASSVDGQRLFDDITVNKDNGRIPGVVVDSNNNLYIITYDITDSSLGEVIYLNANGALTNTNKFDTLLIDDGGFSGGQPGAYFKSINYDKDNLNEVISYYDFDTIGTPSLPTAGRLADLKLCINGFITRIDGHRRFDTDTINTNIFATSGSPGSYPCGFYNDVKLVNNWIYVAYSEFQQSTSTLRLKLAISKDLGQSWSYEYTDTSDSDHARNINLEITNNRIYIIHTNTNNTNNVLITYRDFGSSTWNTINPPNIANIVTYLRAFKDKNNNLHILAINSSLGLANYLFVNTSTNSVNVENLNTQYPTITGFGNFGDIKVDNDLNVYIAINTIRGLTNVTNGNDLLIKRNTTWQAPIRLPNNTSPINYFLDSIRMDIGKF